MQYRVIETTYGPAIRFMDWRAEAGRVETAGACLHVFGNPEARVVRRDYLYGGGGDVEIRLKFNVERLGEAGSVAFHFNRPRPKGAPSGYRVKLTSDRLTVTEKTRVILDQPHEFPLGRNDDITVRFATLGERYALRLNDAPLLTGRMEPPYTDNEGWMGIETRNADIRVQSFEENFIAADMPAPEWRRTELLYEESFTEASLKENWIVNTSTPESGVERQADAFVFRHMCNGFLRQRFDGPIAMECVATPVPTEAKSAGVSDAIFIWMIDKPEGGFFDFLNERSARGDAGLPGLMPLPFYWVDFGGTNNVTTRMRKNPHRHMIRQFTDGPRLLARDKSYRIICVQNGHFVEFHVDGSPLVQAYDEHPLTSGHVGFRAYIADLKVESLKVWRIAP